VEKGKVECLGLDSTEVLALFFEISMHGASSALFNAAFITAAMLQKLLIFHRPPPIRVVPPFSFHVSYFMDGRNNRWL